MNRTVVIIWTIVVSKGKMTVIMIVEIYDCGR